MAAKSRRPPTIPDMLKVPMLPADLLDGYRLYRAGRLPEERRRLAQLASLGQAPHAMVIGCCNSRAAPEVIFQAGPGELFVVRNVANIVPPYAPDGHFHGTSAAIEFAVTGLHVPDIVVLGHSRCGGIKAFLKGDPDARGEFIGPWMDLVSEARDKALRRRGELDDAQLQGAVEEAAIRLSLKNLRTFPALRELEESGAVALHGAHFDISTGELRILDPATDEFRAAVDEVD